MGIHVSHKPFKLVFYFEYAVHNSLLFRRFVLKDLGIRILKKRLTPVGNNFNKPISTGIYLWGMNEISKRSAVIFRVAEANSIISMKAFFFVLQNPLRNDGYIRGTEVNDSVV